MKVYTKIVVDMNTMETIEEESFDYDGEVALCGGGSSGGGGGGSGEVDYPTYMKDAHAQLLYGGSSSSSVMDIVTPADDAINNAVSGNPYIDLSPYNPSPHLVEMANAVDDLDVFINSMESSNEIENNLARFDAGMRDINAVNSSAFVIGRQIIGSTLMVQKLQAKQQLAQLSVETRRMMIVANKEYTEADNEYQVKSIKWPLMMLQQGGNVLASISGAAVVGGKAEEPSTAQSALGGALSGAAIGASVGGAPGAIVGGVIGGVAGAFM